MSYSESIKNSPHYYLYGASAAIVANLIWLSIAKSELNPSKLVLTGLYWDVMLTMCYLIVPIILFNAKITNLQYLGIGVIITGIILTKV